MTLTFVPPQVGHGNLTAYRYGCRCLPCRLASADRAAERRAARRAKLHTIPADDPRHGTISFYSNWGCRCSPCTTAYAEHNARNYYRRRADADASRPDLHG